MIDVFAHLCEIYHLTATARRANTEHRPPLSAWLQSRGSKILQHQRPLSTHAGVYTLRILLCRYSIYHDGPAELCKGELCRVVSPGRGSRLLSGWGGPVRRGREALRHDPLCGGPSTRVDRCELIANGPVFRQGHVG